MPETLTNNHGIEKWTWANVMGDLRDQGGLDGVIIDPFSVDPAGCTGKYSGNHFSISWVKDVLLMLTMEEPSDTLVDAFTKVVNYSPFCRYMDKNGLPTVEWAKMTRIKDLLNLKEEAYMHWLELIRLNLQNNKFQHCQPIPILLDKLR